MKTQLTGTVIHGELQLDASIELPDNLRVNVTVEPIAKPDPDRIAAWEAFKQFIRDNPINSGGLRFTRDELHDRD